MSNAAPSKAHKPGHTYAVPDLLFVSTKDEHEWIIENLIRPGDQVLLAGAPKSGKSLLGLQLAIFAALGGKAPAPKRRFMFAQWGQDEVDPMTKKAPEAPIQATQAWKVLYLSFEMGSRSVSARLRKQIKGLGFTVPEVDQEASDTRLHGLGLYHIFEMAPRQDSKPDEPPRRGLQLVKLKQRDHARAETPEAYERTQDFEDLHDLISKTNPDLVVFDTLIQLHQLSENSNIEMKQVMQAVRAACTIKKTDKKAARPIAHVILHHLRKEGPQGSGQIGAEAMRGAGSIHSEADIAITIKQTGTQWYFQASARDVSVDDLILYRDDETLLFWSDTKANVQAKTTNFKASVFHGLLVDESFRSEHPEGFAIDDAQKWIANNGGEIAEKLEWSGKQTWSIKSIRETIKSLQSKEFIGYKKGGGTDGQGNGKPSRYTFLPEKGNPSLADVETALHPGKAKPRRKG